MNIVMPMAGRGSRFAQIGVEVPKPLIDVRGRPMYAWATDSLPLELARRLIFICLDEHLRHRALEDDIRRRYARWIPEIIPLREITEGQACTVLKADGLIDNDEPLLIYNADTFCRTSLSGRLPALPANVGGLLGVFRAPGDKWSFARTDDHGRVLEVAEKRRISDWASTGLYYFRRGREFVQHARRMIAENERSGGEFYVAPIYNRMIAAGVEIVIDPAEEVWVLGTPEDLRHFNDHYQEN
jgi:UDP-N-acetylglucosamine diphosphorylase / glucose-1-phosphate thymidylyltransferase / UDP-N-acetylgalactosamine diphosphorylase / glucosamine-1-phosphate N-acetyltransferase / galactosamine-1-phosphate N-acetyltransferase